MRLLLMASLAAALHAAAQEPTADRFIHALSSPGIAAFRRSMPEVDIPPVCALRDVLESYAAVEVRKVAVRSPGEHAVQLEIDAVGIGILGERRTLPRLWQVEERNDGRLSVRTAAEVLASSVLAGDDAALRSLAGAPSEELIAGARWMVQGDACRFNVAQCRAAAFLLRDQACTRSLPELGAFAELAVATTEHDAASEAAVEARREAIHLASRSHDPGHLALVYLIAARLADSQFAEQRELLSFARAVGQAADPRLPVMAALELGSVALAEFSLTEAFALFEDAAADARRWRWTRGEALSTQHRARAAASSAHYPAARAFAESAGALANEAGDRELEAKSLNLRGQTHQREGKHELAMGIFRSALAAAPVESIELRSIILTNIAGSNVALGNGPEAVLSIEEALVLARRSRSTWLTVSLNFAAVVAAGQARYEDAIAYLEESVDQFRGSRLWVLWSLQDHLAFLHFDCGRVDTAIDLWYQAVDSIEARRRLVPSSPSGRARYFAEYEHVYASLARALVQAGRLDEALAVSEKIRARMLADDLSLPDRVSNERVQAAEEQVEALNRALVHAGPEEARLLHRQLRDARLVLDDEERLAALRGGSAATEGVPAHDSGASLPPGAAVVELLPEARTDGVIALVLTRDGIHGIELPLKLTEIRRRAARLHELISSRNWRYADEARPLFEALVAPLLPLLGNATRLTIVPSGFLWSVPFEVLTDAGGAPLDDRFVIAYAPSLTLMEKARPAWRGGSELLLLATPGHERSDATFAAQIEKEAAALASLYHATPVTVLRQDEATEARFKELAPHARVLHLAAHGTSDARGTWSGGLLLSSSAADDGLLEAREVARMKLNADIVMLAGCRTGSGTIVAAEGPMGLGWAFLVAGSRTTIVSRWDVSDHATAQLSLEFHRMVRRGQPPAEALRDARRTIRRDARLAHPYYWAAFMAIGR